jgi:hypothetical protein
MKKILIVAAIAAAALFTNPGLDKHRNKINERYKADNPLTGALGGGKLAAAAVQYDDYYLFSMTKLEGNMVSVGIFNLVVVRNLDLNQIL